MIDPKNWKMTIWGAREQNIAIFLSFGWFFNLARWSAHLKFMLACTTTNSLSIEKKWVLAIIGNNLGSHFLSQPIRAQYFILPLKSVLTTEMIVLIHIWHQSEQLIKWLLKTFHQIEKNRKNLGCPLGWPQKFFFPKKIIATFFVELFVLIILVYFLMGLQQF